MSVGRVRWMHLQSPIETVTLIMPLKATTVNNPSNIRNDSGVTAGVTLEE